MNRTFFTPDGFIYDSSQKTPRVLLIQSFSDEYWDIYPSISEYLSNVGKERVTQRFAARVCAELTGKTFLMSQLDKLVQKAMRDVANRDKRCGKEK